MSDTHASPVVISSIVSQLVSPCRSCLHCDSEKSSCMPSCKDLNHFRRYLDAYHTFTLGCFQGTATGSYSLVLQYVPAN